MYITNPTTKQLNSWFKCRKKIADYLIDKGINVIHKNENFYFFVKTDELLSLIDEMPILLKWLYALQIKQDKIVAF